MKERCGELDRCSVHACDGRWRSDHSSPRHRRTRHGAERPMTRQWRGKYCKATPAAYSGHASNPYRSCRRRGVRAGYGHARRVSRGHAAAGWGSCCLGSRRAHRGGRGRWLRRRPDSPLPACGSRGCQPRARAVGSAGDPYPWAADSGSGSSLPRLCSPTEARDYALTLIRPSATRGLTRPRFPAAEPALAARSESR
jgi:hypothetical protein